MLSRNQTKVYLKNKYFFISINFFDIWSDEYKENKLKAGGSTEEREQRELIC